MHEVKAELLAPAGSYKALRSAVLNGADAVYLGSTRFSARAGAENFTDDALKEAVKFCRLHRVKVYLAVNIMLLENEIEDLFRLAEFAAGAGIDGFIVSDLGAAAVLRKHIPDVPLHASTQMTVHSLEGVRLLEKEGFKRVVLSRELSKEEIEYIVKNCKAEIEIFVHGALCMSYSGKCLMSSMIGKRSGNRGKCAQPCRMRYSMDGKRGFLLSPRDLCLVDDIGDIIGCGVASLKIEGRMKSPEYVAVVTSVYRKAIDKGFVTNEDGEKLKEIFCRGNEFTRGYYGGESTKTILNTKIPNDETGRRVPQSLLKEAAATYREGAFIKKVPVFVFVTEKENEVLFKFGSFNDEVTIAATKSKVPPLDEDRVINQVSKTGSTPFYVESVSVTGEIRLKISEVNEIRRRALIKLSEKLSKPLEKKVVPFKRSLENFEKEGKCVLVPYVFNIKQAEVLINKAEEMYVPLEIVNDFKRTEGIFAALPEIIRTKEREKVFYDLAKARQRGIKYALCHSFDTFAVARKAGLSVIAGAGLNIANSFSANEAVRLGAERIIVSAELSFGVIKSISSSVENDVEAIIYGRLPLMITENCIMRGEKCGECVSFLKDRTSRFFPVMKTAYSCRNIIFNSMPLYVADKGFEGYKIKRGILYFTTESPDECVEILEKYKNGAAFDGEFTRGYLLGGKP
jgi:putative protease